MLLFYALFLRHSRCNDYVRNLYRFDTLEKTFVSNKYLANVKKILRYFGNG